MRTSHRLILAVVLLLATGALAAGNPNDVLVAVQPASESLTRAKHARIVEFIEWVFKAPLTGEQRARLGDLVVAEWRTAEGRADMQGWIDGADETEKFPPEQRPLVREKLLEVIVPALREGAKTDADAKWLLAIYDAANKPLVFGKPALTRQAVEASTEMLYFVLGKAHGFEAKPTPADFDEATKNMIASWAKMSAEQKKEVVGAPLQWADLRAAWDAASPADREEVAAGWRKAFPLPEAKPSPFSTTPAQRKALAKLKEIDALLGQDASKQTPQELQRLAGELRPLVAQLKQEPGASELGDKLGEVEKVLSQAAQQRLNAQQARAQVTTARSSSDDLSRRMAASQMMMSAARNQMMFMEQMRQSQFNMIQNLGSSPYRYTNSFGR